eukprot:1161104-Pelagomonas_calceolata.AAC.1
MVRSLAVCARCNLHEDQDEAHVLFKYLCPEVCRVRGRRTTSFFITFEIMDLFLTGVDQSHTDQPDALAEEGRLWHSSNPGMSACIVLRVEELPTLLPFGFWFSCSQDCSQAGLWLDPSAMRKRYFLVGAGLWIVVAKVGTSDGSKFTAEMWIGSHEFGIGVSYNVFSPDREEHESSSGLCAENG